MAMIDFYGMASPNVTKVTIALEEIGEPYNLHPTDIWKGTQFTPEFKRLNPNSKVPIIIDRRVPDAEPIVVFESGAILLYLAELSGQLLPTDPVGRTTTIQWMMIQMTGIGPMFGQYVHFSQYAPKDNHYSLVRYHNEVLKHYELLDRRLGEVAYLAGDDYSIADIATLPWVLNRWTNPEDLHPGKPDPYPNVARWARELKERPAVIRALAITDRLRNELTRGLEASPDEQDRVFNRGRFSRI
ncbi:MAG: glutathione S-transferase N-terminal domain-containing protein [Rhizobiaceae bacterium]|nr:glutathione S-transferase N-terminal domain-containing protein [Rhizobiaceae bacterium]